MAYFVGIITYNRRRQVLDLLEQINLHSYERPGMRVAVIDDASWDSPMTWTRRPAELFLRPDWSYWQHHDRYGKERYWLTYHELLQHFRDSGADRFVSLPDDCVISTRFFQVLDRLFEMGVEVVNFHRDSRHETGCWGSGPPVKTKLACMVDGVQLTVDRVGWVDGFTAATRSAVDAIGALRPIHRDWINHPQLGSGLGAQMTERLRAQEISVHSPSRSLVRHLCIPSQMNPVAREVHALETRDFFDDA